MPGRHDLRGPAVDVADETYVRVPRETLAPIVADPACWSRWWPDLAPRVIADRGVKGQRWAVDGALRGSMEVWLEPVDGGTVLHWYLRAEPVTPLRARQVRRGRERRVLAWKAEMFRLKDRLEAVKDRPGPADVLA